jgi:xyloglucan-specific exo-beta-1,4-glucanase
VAVDVWVTTDIGVWHSLNYGVTFTQIGSGCTGGYSFGQFTQSPKAYVANNL